MTIAGSYRVKAIRRAAKTSILRLMNRSDVSRWSGDHELLPNWDSRTERLAALVRPGASIIEFGAGRRSMETMLPAGCRYTPSDLVDRGPGTLVCDLNAPALPVFEHYDVAVFGGVLEYVHDVPRLVSHVAGFARTVIASYSVAERCQRNRRALGWFNDFTSEELIRIFESRGFVCDLRQPFPTEEIFRFARASRVGVRGTPARPAPPA